MTKWVVFLWCFSIIISNALPRHSLSTTNAMVGDRVIYTVDRPIAMDAPLAWPTMNGLSLVRQWSSTVATHNRDQFEFQVFTIDSVTIPTLSVVAKDGSPTVDLPPLSLVIGSLLPPTMNQLNAIAPLLPIFYIHWGVWVGVAVLCVLIAIFIFMWRRRRYTQKVSSLPVGDRPCPLAVAEAAVDQLRQTLTNDPVIIKAGYFKVTTIFYQYLSDQIMMNVLDATTAEMVRLLTATNQLSATQTQGIIAIAKEMDHFKFSHEPVYELAGIQLLLDRIQDIMRQVAS
ncbi:MAG: hypothetical protein ACO3K7_04775 [Candidatus Marinamargulisbacteria bacterium]